MTHDARLSSDFEGDQVQGGSAEPKTPNIGQQTALATKMLIGPWYLDEFGNPTREIKALD